MKIKQIILGFFFLQIIFAITYLPIQGKNINELLTKKPYDNDYTQVLKDAFAKGERAIYLPPGKYKINSLTVPSDSILFGSGKDTVIYPVGKNIPVFNQENVNDWQITDMKIIGLNPSLTQSEDEQISISSGRLLIYQVSKLRKDILKEKYYGKSAKERDYWGIIRLKDTSGFNLKNISISHADVGISYHFTKETSDSGFLNELEIEHCHIGIFAFNKKLEFNASVVECSFKRNLLGFCIIGEGYFLVSRSRFEWNSTAYYYYTKGTEHSQSIVSDGVFYGNSDFDVRSDGSSQGHQVIASDIDGEGIFIRDNVAFMFIDNILNVANINLKYNYTPAILKGNIFTSYPQRVFYDPRKTIWKYNVPQINKVEKLTGKSNYLIIK